MTKTKSKTKKAKKKEFNWFTELNKLIRCKTTLCWEDHEKLKDRSQRWQTCACGQLCKDLPRCSNGSPKDAELNLLGADFHAQIRCGYWHAARDIMHKIEQRTSKLLMEMKHEKKKSR